MPPLPLGTMIVYTNALILGLISCVALGVVIGVIAVGWFTEWRCTWCAFRKQEHREVEEAGDVRGTHTTG